MDRYRKEVWYKWVHKKWNKGSVSLRYFEYALSVSDKMWHRLEKVQKYWVFVWGDFKKPITADNLV